ncbi:hypothetical protein M422DRAFT_232224 [Sphaerobolus stellatus SS14]|uniref:PITH domain-containing protein n=1 Tax=Sphaerobolus stellatus (strain SS14) TaxID=990650 RepID=A0A0C9VIB1_SPHS4|nr:hypothetical protein M422DRAFT_232224 [Sphaerobolus stellatus SS14]
MSTGTENTNDQSIATQLAGADTTSLFGVIDRDNVHGLNLDVPEQAMDIIKSWDEREDTSKFADSGVDDQVIIHVPFTQNVRVRSIILKVGRGELTPRRLRIYANYPSIVDFGDAESTVPQLDISLLESPVEATEYPLRVAAFANVISLSLFFSEAVGSERTRLYFLGFRGDVSNPKKDVRKKIDLPAANAADASLVDRVSEKSAASQSTVR